MHQTVLDTVVLRYRRAFAENFADKQNWNVTENLLKWHSVFLTLSMSLALQWTVFSPNASLLNT